MIYREKFRDENTVTLEGRLPSDVTTGEFEGDRGVIALYDCETKTTYPVPADKTIKIGRSEDNDIVVYNGNVSRNHCEIREGVFISDCEGMNKTYINGEVLERKRKVLRADDRICLGAPSVSEGGYLLKVLKGGSR